MSALEAKEYGLIDYVIGGDDAGFVVEGGLDALPKTRSEYVQWGAEAAAGDDGSRAARFVPGREQGVGPYGPSQAPGGAAGEGDKEAKEGGAEEPPKEGGEGGDK